MTRIQMRTGGGVPIGAAGGQRAQPRACPTFMERIDKVVARSQPTRTWTGQMHGSAWRPS